MKAYYYDNKEGDQRLRHDSGREVSIPTLASLGIFYRHCPTIAQVDEVAIERKYGCRDEIFVSPKLLGDQYEPKMKTFFSEHLHEDEEIRHIKDGSGFFDVRDKNDEWIRIGLEAGDMVILPAGIYHRFTTDEKDYINAMRLFQTEPKWTPLNRAPELDANQCRVEYLKNRDAQVVA